MYTRQYKLKCENENKPVMERFRIIATQGMSFEALAKRNNVKVKGFLGATDDYFDNMRWEITTKWESKADFEEAIKHPMRKMFWHRFEMEAFKHELELVVIDGDTGEEFRPLESLDDPWDRR